MKIKLSIILVCLTQMFCVGQTYFDNTYKTGYNNLLSSNVLTTPDSGCVFVNYISDSITHKQYVGLIHIDKFGNEVIKKSFSIPNYEYGGFLQGMKQFIPATTCSYFLTGGTYTGNINPFILNKINRVTLDTIKTVIYSNNFSYNVSNFIKLD